MSKLAAFFLFLFWLSVAGLVAWAASGSPAIALAVTLPFLGSWALLTAHDWIRADLALGAIGRRRIDRPSFVTIPLALLHLPIQALLYPAGLPFVARLFLVGLVLAQFLVVDCNALRSWRKRPARKTCSDPATCGSEWCADPATGSAEIPVWCARCGKTGTLEAEASADLRAVAGSVA